MYRGVNRGAVRDSDEGAVGHEGCVQRREAVIIEVRILGQMPLDVRVARRYRLTEAHHCYPVGGPRRGQAFRVAAI